MSIPSYVGLTVYFGPAEDLRTGSLCLAECELGDEAADPALDALGPVGDLVVAFAFAPLGGAVRVADGHPDDRDRRVHAADRRDAGDPPSRAHDHLAADLLAQDPVRRADVVARLRCHGGPLQAEPVLADRGGRLVHDGVLGLAAALEREVVADELELEPDHVRGENAEAFLQELLAGLVAFEDDDRALVAHRRAV